MVRILKTYWRELLLVVAVASLFFARFITYWPAVVLFVVIWVSQPPYEVMYSAYDLARRMDEE